MRKSQKQTKTCPFCGKTVSIAAIACAYCEHDLIDLDTPLADEASQQRNGQASFATATNLERESDAKNVATVSPEDAADTRAADGDEFFTTVPRIEGNSEQFAQEAEQFFLEAEARQASRRVRIGVASAIASVVIIVSAVLVARRDTTQLREKLVPSAARATPFAKIPLSQIPDMFVVQQASILPRLDLGTPKSAPAGTRLKLDVEEARMIRGAEFSAGYFAIPENLRLITANVNNKINNPLTDFKITIHFYDAKGKVLKKVTHDTDMIMESGDNYTFAANWVKRTDLPPDVMNPLALIGPASMNRIVTGRAPLRRVVIPKPDPADDAVTAQIVEISARVLPAPVKKPAPAKPAATPTGPPKTQ